MTMPMPREQPGSLATSPLLEEKPNLSNEKQESAAVTSTITYAVFGARSRFGVTAIQAAKSIPIRVKKCFTSLGIRTGSGSDRVNL
jgi:hypothetical protein